MNSYRKTSKVEDVEKMGVSAEHFSFGKYYIEFFSCVCLGELNNED